MEYFFAETQFGTIFCSMRSGMIDSILFTDNPTDFADRVAAARRGGSVETAVPGWFSLENLILGSDRVPPVLPRGSDFRNKVWAALREIPAGQTVSYSEVAASIGMPRAARAVATAVAANDVAVLVPCHRVVRSGGAPGRYKWGAERKRSLIEYEKSLVGKGRLPDF